MKLLSEKKVKEKRDEKSIELERGVNVLKKAEKNLIENVNVLKEKERDLKGALSTSQNTGQLDTRKAILLNEVHVLEERKKIALIPVEEIQAKVEEEHKEALKQTELVIAQKERYEIKNEELVELTENVADKESALNERSDGIDKEEERVKFATKELKKSTEHLGEKWGEYHTAILGFNDDVKLHESRKAKVDKKEKGLLVTKQENADKETDLEERELKLTDGREELHRAWSEVNTKKQQNGGKKR